MRLSSIHHSSSRLHLMLAPSNLFPSSHSPLHALHAAEASRPLHSYSNPTPASHHPRRGGAALPFPTTPQALASATAAPSSPAAQDASSTPSPGSYQKQSYGSGWHKASEELEARLKFKRDLALQMGSSPFCDLPPSSPSDGRGARWTRSTREPLPGSTQNIDRATVCSEACDGQLPTEAEIERDPRANACIDAPVELQQSGSRAEEEVVQGDAIKPPVEEASPLSATKKSDMQAEVVEDRTVSQNATSTSSLSTLANGIHEACKASPQLQKVKRKKKDSQGLPCSLEDVLMVGSLDTAKDVISRLRGEYKDHVHACDTEVTDINLKNQSPIGHGKITCFSIYCGPNVDFGSGKACVWVDVLDGGVEILHAFKEYFEDSSIKKVWHNYSFDCHSLYNYDIMANGFYADTMHLARLWNSGRTGSQGGYSLESLTGDCKVMDGVHSSNGNVSIQKTSMKDLFGIFNVKKDGTPGKLKVIPPVVELQRDEATRGRWICYSSGDAVCTWKLWESLKAKLERRPWKFLDHDGTMYDLYEEYWRPFGELLVQIECTGMLVNRGYLANIEKVALVQQNTAAGNFRKWAAKHCPDACYINISSDSQIRQLLYGGCDLKFSGEALPIERQFLVPNVDGYIEEGKKTAKKNRPITIRGIGVDIPVIKYTEGGLPAVSAEVLKTLAGKVSSDYPVLDEKVDETTTDFPHSDEDDTATAGNIVKKDLPLYGEAYTAFGGGIYGKEACEAIASLCEVSTIDTLISSFIKKLQGNDIVGKDKRIHCSINLNTETGRLSARRPNLQNQPALDKDRYKIRKAFIANEECSLIVADYEQLELRILAHLSECRSMLDAFEMGGDFHSRTAMNMYEHVRKAVENGMVLLEWEPKPGEEDPPAPLLKDVFAAERRKAKMLNFSIAYGKTAIGLSKDWKVSVKEAENTLKLWYKDKQEVRRWQDKRKIEAIEGQCVYTLLGRPRHFPDVRKSKDSYLCGHIQRAAINTPVQGSAADVAMCAMLEIAHNPRLKELRWKLIMQVHDEVILEGPSDTAEEAKGIVVKAMSNPFNGKNILSVNLSVNAKFAGSWYDAK